MTKNQIRAILRAYAVRCPYRSCWTIQGRAWLRSLKFDEGRTWVLRHLTDEVERYDKAIGELEVQLDAIAKKQPNVALLQTVPGIGPRTAEAIVAFTDRVDAKLSFPLRKAPRLALGSLVTFWGGGRTSGQGDGDV